MKVTQPFDTYKVECLLSKFFLPLKGKRLASWSYKTTCMF